MTPKQKANELISLHSLTILSEVGNYLTMDEVKHLAKQCALIAVDEILNAIDWDYYEGSAQTQQNYWKEVKQEIEKL
jgi:hypothetical protein